MNPTQSRFRLRLTSRQWLACGAVLCAAASASALAQGVYRIVGPDGKVTFSDQPPPAAAKNSAPAPATGATGGSASPASGGRLPIELRKVSSQFPVVLYTGKDCSPCNSGRNLLINRGIPFAEKTIDNNESVAALKQFSGQNSIPLLTIGSQQLKGFSDTNWSQYLTAAGYPEKSVLPGNYQQPAAAPLAEASRATATNNAPKAAEPAEEAAPVREVPVAPPSSGIRF